MRERVVVTGVGAVNAALAGGSAALGAWLAAPRLAAHPVGSIFPGLVDETEARRLSRICQLTVAAARLALADAGIDPARGLGVVLGTEFGDFRSTVEFADGFLRRGPAGLSPLLFPNTVMNTMAATTAIAVGARELSFTLNAPVIAGELAVARAATAIGAGRVGAALAGGVDELEPIVVRTRAALGAREADALGEGATFLVLESWAAARERGAPILGEIVSAAWRALPARPHGVGRHAASRAIAAALEGAALGPGQIGWVYGSASGDEARDAWERALLAAALAPRMPAIASLAGLVGRHAGLGALRVAAAAWTARSGLLPQATPSLRVTRVPPGAGLVHAVARGGGHVALVVAPPPEEP